jgi:hypothetical protein
MTRRISSAPDISDERRDELDALLVEYVDLARRQRALRSEANAKTAELRQTVSRMFRESEAEQKSLKKKRDAIAARLTEAWKNEFPEVQSAVFPSARVDRATCRTITTKDKPALLEKLKGLKRLDVVEPVVNEMELLALSRTGALDDLPEKVIVIDDVPEIRVRRRKDI